MLDGGMPTELLFLRQLLTPNYAQVTMLVGLLLVAIYRPERICLPGMFRLSCVLLAVSIPVTAVTTLFLMNAMIDVTGNGLSRMGNARGFAVLFSMLQVIEPILVGLSIFFGFFSLLPRRGQRSPSGPDAVAGGGPPRSGHRSLVGRLAPAVVAAPLGADLSDRDARMPGSRSLVADAQG